MTMVFGVVVESFARVSSSRLARVNHPFDPIKALAGLMKRKSTQKPSFRAMYNPSCLVYFNEMFVLQPLLCVSLWQSQI